MASTKTSSVQSSEMTDTLNLSQNSMFPDLQPSAEQNYTAPPKSAKPTAKQRKLDLEEYRTAFFAPIKLGKDNKHQVAISNDTFERVDKIARIFGGSGYSVSSFVEHIINEHLECNADNYGSWFAIISKSFLSPQQL